MHRSLLISLATAATGALAGPLRRQEASTTEYACNPAHAYPEGVQCVSTNGGLSLVTPTPAPSSTGYACNPAHAYPEGVQCVSTNGGLSLVTPTPAPSSTAYACNPAHEYPEGVRCVSTNGGLSLVTPTAAASSTGFACNPAHSYPNGASCISTNGALTLATPTASASSSSFLFCNAAAIARGDCTATAASVPTAAASSAASSAVEAVATEAATSGETIAEDLTWTVENLSRYCAEDRSGCDYNFNLTASDDRPAQACTIIRIDVEDAPVESWTDIACTDDSPIKVSWGYSDQFGAKNAFAVMTVVNDQEKAKAYFGVANINGEEVTPSNPFGSAIYGDIGPQPVYLF